MKWNLTIFQTEKKFWLKIFEAYKNRKRDKNPMKHIPIDFHKNGLNILINK